MKKTTLLLMLMLHVIVFAQTDGINYQAVIIDNNPQEIPGVDIQSNNLPNAPLEVRFTILDDSNSVIYQETHQTETDPFGMINLMIGQGAVTSQSPTLFGQIYWNNPKQLKVEIDLFDGNGLVEFSNQKLTYIPYVRHREIIATSTLDVDGATNLNNSLSVNNQSPTELSGTLTVDNDTNLNSNLTVNNQSPTYLTGDLTVDGLVSFDGELAVGGDTNLYSDLTVSGNTLLEGNLNVLGISNFSDGIFENISVTQNSALNVLDVDGVTNINNAFNVNNGNLASLSGNLSVDGGTSLNSTLAVTGTSTLSNTLTVNSNSNLNGQVIVDANMDAVGGDLFSAAHPLRVKGSRQGISIELTGISGGTPNSGNNFLSFTNANNVRYGRIEGQTSGELSGSFMFVWHTTMVALETAFQVAMVAFDVIGVDDFDVAVVEGFEMVNVIANWTAINTYNAANVGVSFSSGFGDYAEWLEKNDYSEGFNFGDIVGVIGGKITKNTKEADHYMVISQNPIVLGNMQDDEHQKYYEKVAFMGQVPVKVIGKVSIGDYIVPSGLNDGIGKAISPKQLKLSEYAKVVGVAWSASETNTLSMINLAVGINANNTSQVLTAQQNEINKLKKEINMILSYLKEKDESFRIEEYNNLSDTHKNEGNKAHSDVVTNTTVLPVETIATTRETSEVSSVVGFNNSNISLSNINYKKIVKMLEEHPEVLSEILSDARELLKKRGVDYTRYEQTNKLVTDGAYFLNYLREMAK
ncbi:hypothetical protein [uncultured Psychroserpens sp.]|uniref:hypothetical protein n=1 Tax=uncultured Psychroserpens sp. TaxID=255436 RepID=UPI0026259276|nr:hypothetical protein [uncultured Psychroserpens sp.]